MNLNTYFKFLTGDRDSIIKVAEDSNNYIYGAILVLSAGLSREYDWHYLPAGPWHLLKPFLGSTLVAFLIFNTLKTTLGFKYKLPGGYFRSFRSFLGVFWLTAPFAWPYCIPYERFTTPLTTAKINLWTLLIVSILRVSLMVRIVSVLTNLRVRAAIPQVMKICSIVAFFALIVFNSNIVGFMGGIQNLTDVQKLMINVTGPLVPIAFFGIPIFFTLSLILNRFERPYCTFVINEYDNSKINKRLMIFSVSAILIWLPILPFTQREQYHASKVYNLLMDGEIKQATKYMNSLELHDFPPQYEPYLNSLWIPHFEIIQRDFNTAENKDWVNNILSKKFLHYASNSRRYIDTAFLKNYADSSKLLTDDERIYKTLTTSYSEKYWQRSEIKNEDLISVSNLEFTHLYLSNTPITEKGLSKILHPEKLILLDLGRSNVNEFSFLRQMLFLEILNLSFSNFSDQDMVFVEKLYSIVDLNLSNTQVSCKFAPILKNFKKLKYLNLSNTGIADECLDELNHLQQLKTVNLSKTKITGRSVTKLSKLSNLRLLYLNEIEITEKELHELVNQLPKLKIIFKDGDVVQGTMYNETDSV